MSLTKLGQARKNRFKYTVTLYNLNEIIFNLLIQLRKCSPSEESSLKKLH